MSQSQRATKDTTYCLLTSLFDVLILAAVTSVDLTSAVTGYRLLTAEATWYRLIVSADCGCITFNTRAGICCCEYNKCKAVRINY